MKMVLNADVLGLNVADEPICTQFGAELRADWFICDVSEDADLCSQVQWTCCLDQRAAFNPPLLSQL